MQTVLLVENKLDSSRWAASLQSLYQRLLKIQYSPLFLSLVKEFSPDLIIIDLNIPSDQLINDLRQLNQQLTVPIILFTYEATPDLVEQIIQADVSAFIVGDVATQRLQGIINIALARFKYIQALKGSLNDIRHQLEDRKHIDQAKAILIKAKKCTEDEAYHTLRKLAMTKNMTLGKIARQVVDMAALLK